MLPCSSGTARTSRATPTRCTTTASTSPSTVNDVNEPPVIDSSAETALNVLENTVAGENIGSPIDGHRPRRRRQHHVFAGRRRRGGLRNRLLRSDQDQGTPGPGDKGLSYTVTVTATDSGNLEDTHTVTITVTDDEHEPPRFNEEYADGETSLTREVAENTAVRPACRRAGVRHGRRRRHADLLADGNSCRIL